MVFFYVSFTIKEENSDLKFFGMLREIYSDYMNQIEPYGCDESWHDLHRIAATATNGLLRKHV